MLLKFAYAETLSVERLGQADVVRKSAHRAVFAYEPRPGFLYVRSRAISSRTNDNYDTFPGPELEKSWMTFIGRPVFVNHQNDDPTRARGVIIDAALHVDTALDGSEDTWVEVLQEIDGLRFPKLAQAIVNGDIERTSMGCDVAYSLCSFCGNKAATPLEYCAHIPRLKGKRIRRVQANGSGEDVLIHEICFGLGFFENSLLVEPPADPTAFFLGVDTRGMAMTASRRTAADYGRAPGNATEVQKHDPPLKGRSTRAFNVGVGWGSMMHNTGDQRVVVPAGTEGTVDLTWRDSGGVLRCRITFDSQHVQGEAHEGGPAEATIVVDERFVDLMGGSITAPAPPARDPKAKCLMSGERLKFGNNEWSVPCPACGAMVKNTRQTTYAAHKPGAQIDDPPCPGSGKDPVKKDGENRWTCPDCDLYHSMSKFGKVPDHKTFTGMKYASVTASIKWRKERQGEGEHMWLDETGDLLVTYTGYHPKPWSFDAFTDDDGMADHLGDFSTDGEAFRAAEAWVANHRTAKDDRDHGNTDKGNTTDRGYGWDHQQNREELLEGDPKCHWCHDAKATQADHTTGGKLVPSCAPCNNERSHEQQKRSKLGYGEVRAPAQIDTLRIRECPVCGEEDSWDGDGRCRACGYLPPPEPFRDPDLDVAQKADMREGPVNPEIFKAPPFVVPEDKPEDEDDNKLDPSAQGTDPSLTFRSSNPVRSASTPHKVQSEGEPMSRPSVATLASQQAIIERQGEQIKLLRQRNAALLRRFADVDNPGNPVAEPGSASPSQGTSNEDVRSADANTEVTTPGGVMDPPPPMATTTPTQPGAAASTDALLVSNEAPTETTSVTAPVGNAGTQPSLTETKTEIQPETGGEAIGPNFLGGDWANKAASLVAMTQEHTLASLRLARLRLQAGTAQGDDLSLAQRIAATMELPAVRAEIKTLAAVAKARPAAPRPVGRTAARSMPSLVSSPSPMQTLGSRPSMDPSDDEFLFID